MVSAAMAAGAVLLMPGTAWADHCVNVSRGAGNAQAWETVRGRWIYIAPEVGSFWAFDTPDNFHDGKSDGLLDGSGACNASRLMGQTKGAVSIDALNGIWSESCVNEALGQLGG